MMIFALSMSVVFTACDNKAEDNGPCSHVEKWVVDKEPTCLEQGLKHKECELCGQDLNEEQTIYALGHDFSNFVSNGDGTHTRTCKRDATHKESADCAGGIATETEKAKCEFCGGEYDEVLEHEHEFKEEVVDDIYLSSKATYTAPAKYFYSCVCGEKGTEVFTNGSPLEIGEHLVVKLPTCTAEGYIAERCNVPNCPDGGLIILEKIQPLGHDIKWNCDIEVSYREDKTVEKIAFTTTAMGKCQRENCGASLEPTCVIAKVNGEEICCPNSVIQNCCQNTLITYEFYFDDDRTDNIPAQKIYEESIEIQPHGKHEFTSDDANASPSHGEEIVIVLREAVEEVEGKTYKIKYTAKWCYLGQCFVEQTPIREEVVK